MSELIFRNIGLKSLNEEARSVDFVASSDALDSWDEIVEQDWVLERYLTNPVVLFAHNSRDLPIGQCTRVEVVQGSGRPILECTVQFATANANPLAEQVWQSVKEGTLRAVSVGFTPGEYRLETRNGREVYVLSNNQLYEISVVPVPANPEALAKMRARALKEATERSARPPQAEHAPEVPADMALLDEVNERSVREDEETSDMANTIEELTALLGQRDTTDETRRQNALVTQRDAELRQREQELAESRTKIAALEAQNVKLATERDAAVAEASKLRDAVLERELDALVGHKIDPAERDTFFRLAKIDRKLFDDMIGQRAARPTLQRIIPSADPQNDNDVAAEAGYDGADAVAEAERLGRDLGA